MPADHILHDYFLNTISIRGEQQKCFKVNNELPSRLIVSWLCLANGLVSKTHLPEAVQSWLDMSCKFYVCKT